MTVEDSAIIDFVAHSPNSDEVLLVLVEHRPWGSDGGLLPDLQAKLNTYLEYVISGQLVSDYPELNSKPVQVQLRTVEEPGTRDLEFLSLAEEQHFGPAGIRLSWKRTKLDAGHDV